MAKLEELTASLDVAKQLEAVLVAGIPVHSCDCGIARWSKATCSKGNVGPGLNPTKKVMQWSV